MFDRWYAEPLRQKLDRPFVHILFGARQTGKSTLLNTLLPPESLRVDLSNPEERSRYLARPGEFIGLCRAFPRSEKARYVFVDEVQSVPAIFDAVQHLYDSDKGRWRFVLCGSSARKLRRAGTNLLPGRSFLHHLYPLVLAEQPPKADVPPYADSFLPLPWAEKSGPSKPFPAWGLEDRLAYGSLPGVVVSDQLDRPELLKAYAMIHLEEEVRREALVKDWGAFVRFLQLAAAEAGSTLNYTSLSREAGVSIPTIKSYYQLLEDMFVGFRVPAFTRSRRKNLLSTPRFFFFDLGVRHATAALNPSVDVVLANPGPVFEQWVGIEVWKRLQYGATGRLHYQRTRDGAEVDFIVEKDGVLTPIEVKWTDRPSERDARHLMGFLAEHKEDAKHGYVICRCPRPLQLQENITALPWSFL